MIIPAKLLDPIVTMAPVTYRALKHVELGEGALLERTVLLWRSSCMLIANAILFVSSLTFLIARLHLDTSLAPAHCQHDLFFGRRSSVS